MSERLMTLTTAFKHRRAVDTYTATEIVDKNG